MAPVLTSLPPGTAGAILGGAEGIALLLGAAAVLLALGLIVYQMLQQRRLVRGVRRIVDDLERLRGGEGPRQPEGPQVAPLNLVSDAVRRVGREVQARLAGSEDAAEQLRVVLQALRDSAMITIDLEGRIRTWSSGATEWLGWEEQELVGKPAQLVFGAEAYQALLPRLARPSLREQGIRTRTTLRTREGRSVAADVILRLLQDPDGVTSGFLLVARDASAAAELEARLRAADERYRGLVEGLSDGLLILRAGQIAFANPAFARLCELPAETLEGSSLRERLATRDVLLFEEQLAALERQAGQSTVLRCRLLDGEGQPSAEVRMSATSIVDADGRPSVLALVHDETVERRVESELRRNESHLDAVLEATSDGILVLSEGTEEGRVQMTNRAWLEMLGCRPHEILGRSVPSLLGELRGRGSDGAAIAELLADTERESHRDIIMLKGPRPRKIEATIATLRDRDGERLGRVLACRDLTEQYEAQRKLQRHAEQLQLSKVMLEQAYRRIDRANQQLHARTQELDAVNRELRKLDEMKSNLLSNVSHELQTPLVSIRGYTEMILKNRLGETTEEQRKGLSLCLKNIDRLISMIDNLLVFARSEPELGELKLGRFPLRGVVDEAVELLRDKIEARGLSFASEIAEPELIVQADRDKILQVFLNLLSNAIKFNRPGGSIRIVARPADHRFARVRVEDSGVGIPHEALDRVFDRHYQVRGEEPGEPRGSGIGLAIVRDILRMHGCRVDLESEEGRGTRVVFTLPLADRDDARSELLDAGEDEVPSSAATESAPSEARGDGEDERPDDPARRRPRFRVIRREGA